MTVVNVHEAKTHLSRLLARVAMGEEIIITESNKPVAKLVPIDSKPAARKPGSARGSIWIAPDFEAPLPEDIVTDFEGTT